MPSRWIAPILGLLLVACGRESTPPGPAPDPEAPRQVLQNVEMRQTSQRGSEWVLKAREARSYREDEPTRLEGLTVLFYDGGPNVRSTLTSRRGEIRNGPTSLVAEDSVVVITGEGERLETEHLEWDPDAGQVQTTYPFTLYRGADVVTGVGIHADPDLSHYTVNRELRVEIRDEVPKEDEF